LKTLYRMSWVIGRRAGLWRFSLPEGEGNG